MLAANIFDWGAQACVELYHNGSILDMYRLAREKLSKRPWALDQFDAFSDHLLGQQGGEGEEGEDGECEWGQGGRGAACRHLLG